MHIVHVGLAANAMVFCTCTIYITTRWKPARSTGKLETGDMMSEIETNRSLAVGGLGSVVASLFSLVGSWRDVRSTKRELSRLSDRELDDIGLCRGDIQRVARSF
ncbi:DUF1127 domain-containing protein [Paracoccus spongiarum]